MKRVQLILAIAIGSILMLTSCSNYNRISYSKVGKKETKQNIATTTNQDEQVDADLTLVSQYETSQRTEINQDEIKQEKSNAKPEIKKEKKESKFSTLKNTSILSFQTGKYEKETIKTIVARKKAIQESFTPREAHRSAKTLGDLSFALFFLNLLLFGVAAIAGLVLGFMALNRMGDARGPGSGRRGAIAGIILNGAIVAAVVLIIIVILIFAATGGSFYTGF